MINRSLGQDLTKDLDPHAVDEVWAQIEARRGAVSHRKKSWALVAVATLVAVFLFVHLTWNASEPVLHLASGASLPKVITQDISKGSEIALDDGSHLFVERDASLIAEVNTAHAFGLTLNAGTVTFEVKPGGPRAWTIDAGFARVFVLGTRFRVTREPRRVRVEVERGTVLVTSHLVSEGERTLTAGQSVEIFDNENHPDFADRNSAQQGKMEVVAPVRTEPVKAQAFAQSSVPSPLRSAPKVETPAIATSWRSLAANGDHVGAYKTVEHDIATETLRATSVEDLLQLADVARLSGHSQEAVAPLERLLATHSEDPRASTAAFTLGKILLDSLGSPQRAASAFERAVLLGPPGALREDAFARRVEAYAKSGDVESARASRTRYEQAFPGGRYHAAVKKWAPP